MMQPMRCPFEKWLFIVSLSMLTACATQSKTYEKYFKSKGLNPLQTVRSDIKPGYFLVEDGSRPGAWLEGISKWVTPSAESIVVSSSDCGLYSGEITGRLDKSTDARGFNLDTTAAKNYLSVLLAVDWPLEIALTSVVNIDFGDVKISRLPPGQIQELNDDCPAGHAMFEAIAQYRRVYVVYETYRTNRISILRDVAINPNPAEPNAVAGGGRQQSWVFYNAGRSLDIAGQQDYVFAVKFARIGRESQKPVVRLLETPPIGAVPQIMSVFGRKP